MPAEQLVNGFTTLSGVGGSAVDRDKRLVGEISHQCEYISGSLSNPIVGARGMGRGTALSLAETPWLVPSNSANFKFQSLSQFYLQMICNIGTLTLASRLQHRGRF
jgi:hypothetical protein